MIEQSLSFEQYLADLPPDRRAEVQRVWQLVREHVPEGYVESIGPKFLSFTADGEWYVALANQKQYISLYLMPIYAFPEMKARLDTSGKPLKCGKSCINFKRAGDLPLDIIAEIVGAFPAEAYVSRVQRIRAESKTRKPAR